MRALVIGGTRNLGPSIVTALLRLGYEISVFNRGKTHAVFPAEVERLHGDRTNAGQLQVAVGKRSFDLIVDTTLYTGPDAQTVLDLFRNRTNRYIFLSTGQVYLVRTEIERPFKEEDYAGPVTPAPPRSAAFDHKNWIYGMEKRAAEDALIRGWAERQFPVTIRRLPMVNSERDHLNRIYGYFLRLRDGGPILLPVGVDLPLRHVYGEDVVQAISRLAGSDTGRGRAYNLSQDETVSLEEFLATMAELTHKRLRVVRLPRERLNEAGLLPDCSPFSDPWMSAVENARSKAELGIRFTPLATYLECLIHSFEDGPLRVIDGYSRRGLELQLANA